MWLNQDNQIQPTPVPTKNKAITFNGQWGLPQMNLE